MQNDIGCVLVTQRGRAVSSGATSTVQKHVHPVSSTSSPTTFSCGSMAIGCAATDMQVRSGTRPNISGWTRHPR